MSAITIVGQQSTAIKPTTKQIVAEMTAQVALIQAAMTGVMKDGEHYGNIPGCGDKKTLLKSGAEKLMVLFRLGVEPVVEAIDDGDSISYRVKSRLFHIETGNTVGFGLGECSSLEDKYNWRSAVCEQEYNATTDDRKRVKWSKGSGGNSYSTNQIRTNYKDLANTVLKMAKKRSLVDAVLTCTAASDCFTQDLEDFDPEYAAELAKDGRNSKAHQNNNVPPKAPHAANASSSDETAALKAHGMWISTADGFDIVEGNTYQKGDVLKPFGFKWDSEKKKWKRQAKPKSYAAEKPSSTAVEQSPTTIDDLDSAISEIGGILSPPTPNGKGKVFVQATGMEIDDTTSATLGELGFVLTNNKWVKEVTNLYPHGAEEGNLFG